MEWALPRSIPNSWEICITLFLRLLRIMSSTRCIMPDVLTFIGLPCRGFLHRLSLCNVLWTAGTINQKLDLILNVAHTLPISHDESRYTWNVLRTKNVPFRILFLINFQVTRHFFLVLCRNDYYYPNEITTVGTHGTQLSSMNALLYFYNSHL